MTKTGAAMFGSMRVGAIANDRQPDVLWLWARDVEFNNLRVGSRLTWRGRDVRLVRRVGANYGAWRGYRIADYR